MNPESKIQKWIESAKEHPKYIELLDYFKEGKIVQNTQDEKLCRVCWALGYFSAIEELNGSE